MRLLRTNLSEEDVQPVKEQLTQSLFDHIPVGVGSKGIIPMNAKDLDEALEMGMDWSLREGYVWAEDKEHCEEYGRMLNADPTCVSMRKGFFRRLRMVLRLFEQKLTRICLKSD